MESLRSAPVREAVHPLLGALLKVGRLGGFEGTCTVLLARLEEICGREAPRWPRSPERLSRMLGWAAQQLREQGLEVRRVRRGHKGERILVIRTLDAAATNRQQGTDGGQGGNVSSAPASAEETPDPWRAALRELGADAGPFAQTSAVKRGDAYEVTFRSGYDLDDVRERHLAVLCAALTKLFGRSPRRLTLAIRGGESVEVAPEELVAVQRRP